jgi:hypothetical protein
MLRQGKEKSGFFGGRPTKMVVFGHLQRHSSADKELIPNRLDSGDLNAVTVADNGEYETSFRGSTSPDGWFSRTLGSG